MTEGLVHDTLTVIPEGTDYVTQIHDAVVSTGQGWIQTADGETYDVSLNARNARKLAVMLTDKAYIYLRRGAVQSLGVLENQNSVNDDTRVFLTID